MKTIGAIPSILMVLLFSWQLTAAAQATDILSCYQMAAKTDPVLARAEAVLEAAKAGRPLAWSKLLPRAKGEAEVSARNVLIKGFLPYTIDDDYIHDAYSVSLEQSILNGPAWAGLRAADENIKAAEAALMAARQDLIARVVQAYFGVLKARADAQVAHSNRRRLKRIYDQARQFLEQGTGDVVAVHEARARLDAAESDVIAADNAVRIARQELERLTHAPLGCLQDVREGIKYLKPEPDDAEAWVKAALEHQPLLAQAKSHFLASEHLIEKARRERWPKLEFYAARTYAKGEMLPEVRAGEWMAGLKVSLPLFLGGEIGAKVKEAVGRSLAAKYQLENVRDEITLATQTAFLNLRNSVAQVQAAKQAVESARISLEATQKAYEVGTRTVVDVMDRITDYDRAWRRYNLALYSHITARVALKHAAGLLTDQDIRSINALLKADGGGN